MSEKAIRDLAGRGVIERARRGQYRLAGSIRRYIEHLRKMASARGGEDSFAAIRAERTRLLRE